MKRHSRNIHERFLQHIWSKQYLTASTLRTADGKPLRVVAVGELNLDGGPDFHNAKVKIGSTSYSGDVEIHRNAFEWLQHQHQEDPRYNKVVLHVVLESDPTQLPTLVRSGRNIPVFVLGQFLSESIRSVWQKAILDERARTSETIKCYARNEGVSADLLHNWLNKLAVERLELKLRRFDERLKELARESQMTVRESPRTWGDPAAEGNPEEIPPPLPELTQKDFSRKNLWEQILYEGIMEGLGYSKNREPFVKLARSLSLERVRGFEVIGDRSRLEGLLFGVAGLIPKVKDVEERESKERVRSLRRTWKELRATFYSEILHAGDWQFFPTRPSNFPTIRSAAATTLIQRFLSDDLFRKIIQAMKSGRRAEMKQIELVTLLSVETDDFWKRHYHFDQPTKKTITALGISRIRDILVNTILPVALLYARIFKDKEVRKGALDVFRSLPPSDENSLTRLMESQLLKGRVKLDNVCFQQATIQLYKYYCIEGRCSECAVGKIVFGDQHSAVSE